MKKCYFNKKIFKEFGIDSKETSSLRVVSDNPAVKSMDCSLRELWFDSQHQHDSSKLSETPVPGSPTPFPGSAIFQMYNQGKLV